jgi:hypothetical protein
LIVYLITSLKNIQQTCPISVDAFVRKCIRHQNCFEWLKFFPHESLGEFQRGTHHSRRHQLIIVQVALISIDERMRTEIKFSLLVGVELSGQNNQ